jgi:hypothetical protein
MWAEYSGMISDRRLISSPLEMDFQVEYGAKGDTGTVHVEVVAVESLTVSDLHLRLALIESDRLYFEDVHDQIMRDYLPDISGTYFLIAEGDTFALSQDFVVDTTWAAENCRIVAFVQDDESKEVVQAVQDWIIAPPPDEVEDLTITLAGEDLLFEWSPVSENTHGESLKVDLYNIYRNSLGSYDPEADPWASTVDTFYADTTGVVGDTGIQLYYWVTAVAGDKESESSGGVGEFDRQVVTGK